MKIIDRMAFLYIEEGKVLSTRSRGKDLYYIPGGKREENETDIQTLIREIKEELGVDIIESSIKYYGTFKAQAYTKEEGIQVKNAYYTAEFKGQLVANPNEIAEIVWFNFSDIDKVSPVDKIVFKDLSSKNLLK